jgi:hypothetical protein
MHCRLFLAVSVLGSHLFLAAHVSTAQGAAKLVAPGDVAVPLRDAPTVAPPAPPFAVPWLAFNTALTFGNGSPVALATGDLDGDGDIDVVAPRGYFGGGFTFLRNEGAGRFAQPVDYPGSSKAAGIAVADLNGDGRLDVVVSDGDGLATGNTLSTYLGNGDGTFGPRQAVTLSTGRALPIGVVAADFNGDGRADLAVAANGAASVLLLHNNGNGTFLAPVAFPVGARPADIAAGDLNGDGRADLAIAHEEYRVSVLLNNGTGGFATATGYDNLHLGTFWASPQLPAIAVADVDRDGRVDVLYGNTRTWDGDHGQVIQLRNTGNGAFARAADIPMQYYSAGPTDLVAADINGDGAADILAASYSGRSSDGVCVLMNNGSGSFGPAVLYPAGQSTRGLAAADVNGDGTSDVLTADDYSNAITVRYNPGNGVFPVIPQDFAGSAQFYQDAADIDGDGDVDIFTSGPRPSADDGAIMRNNGTGRFTRTVVSNGFDGVASGVLRDLNGDGKPDLLFNNANTAPQSDFFTAMNNGNGTFGQITRWMVRSAGWGAIDAFDIDGDGDLDVIDCEALGAPDVPNGRFFIALNNGNGTFQTPYAYAQLPTRPDAVAGGDFNHDGKMDLAFANNGAYGYDSSVFIVLGNGNGTFQPPIIYTAGRGPLYIVTADFDRDGNLDLATLNTGYNGEGAESLTLLFGTGTGTFNRLTTQYAPYSPDLLGATGLAVGDVDGDGDPDLLTSGVSKDVGLYLNDGAGVFSFPYRMGAVAGAHAVLYRDFTGDGVGDLALLTSPPPLGFAGGVAIVRGLGTVSLVQAVSRKTHGGSGTFDIDLPLTGTPGVECRSGGAGGNHQLVLTFATPVTVGGVGVTSSDGMATATQSANGAVVTVNLASVANAQILGITLQNVSNGGAARDVAIPFRVLAGDSSGNGSVTATDIGQVKGQSGQPVTGTNFRTDVNASGGTISASDIGLVKAASGTQLP